MNDSGDLVTREMGPEFADDWLRFFDGPAFADNPDWAGCYCRAFLFRDGFDAWDEACASGANRAPMEVRARNGELGGHLAYAGGEVVGWCHSGPRETFAGPPPDGAPERVLSVVCFLVAAPWRRRGVARRLLDATVESAARAGYDFVEARIPRDAPAGAPHLFPGPRPMYEAAGFVPVSETATHVVLRLPLAGR